MIASYGSPCSEIIFPAKPGIAISAARGRSSWHNAMNAQSASITRSRPVVPRVVVADSRFRRNYPGLLASLGFTAFLLVSAPALAATSPPLGTAASYTVLGTNSIPTAGTVTCTNTGSGSTINGDVGSTFTSITNIACTITGTIDTPVAGSVVNDFNNAYSALDSLNPTCDGVVPTTNTTLAPGVYCSAAGTTISAGVILTLSGSAADVWVFKIGTGGSGALTGNSFQVVMGGTAQAFMGGTAQACNVYWRTAEAATMTDSDFKGTLLAGGAITSTRGSYEGRALARTDVTVTDAAPMTFAGCAAPAAITVNKDFLPNSVATVPVALTCTSGTVTTTPLNASEATPAVFTVTGASPGATCTATETVPAGYTADQTNCASVALGGSCTITNTLIPPLANIPTLSEWAMILLAGLLALFGFVAVRRQAR